MPSLIKMYPTIKNYRRWKKIVKENRKELENKGFSINWVYQLGKQVTLRDEDINDIEYMKKSIEGLGANLAKSEIEDFQLSIMIENYKNLRIAEEFKKHNDFFFSTGLSELIIDEFDIEQIDENGYIYSTIISYGIEKGLGLTFLIDVVFTLIVWSFVFLKSIKNNV